MRLIDADEFEKFIKEKYKDFESTDDIKDQMLFDLSYQPTAYDVEKVIRQLGCQMERRVNYFPDRIRLDKAIYIVRNGGKE